ncbi:MAG: peptide chain release factor N(5)-glutamine methyltransferase [Saprospiraceae bacterium]
MNSKYQELCQFFEIGLSKKYNFEESTIIFNYIFKSDFMQNIISNNLPLNLEGQSVWSKILDDLLLGRPIQYCLGESYFFDLVLYVDERVLIPRPETEELVDWCIRDNENNAECLTVLDIGTGSGAIPIQLAKKYPYWKIESIDKYQDALDVANINTNKYKVEVQLTQLDFLRDYHTVKTKYDIVISNPPYILDEEKKFMNPSVLDFEPLSALFAEDLDPLIFYRKIAEFGQTNLKNNGRIYCEINEFHWEEIFKIFRENNYVNLEIRKDLQGKKRMIRAIRS